MPPHWRLQALRGRLARVRAFGRLVGRRTPAPASAPVPRRPLILESMMHLQATAGAPADRLAAMRRAYRDLSEEIAAERASPVVDFVFLREMQDRQQRLKGEMARVFALTPDGAL